MTNPKPKPESHLLSGSEVFNPEALAKFYANVTGKPFTPELVEECRQSLAEARKRHSKPPEQ